MLRVLDVTYKFHFIPKVIRSWLDTAPFPIPAPDMWIMLVERERCLLIGLLMLIVWCKLKRFWPIGIPHKVCLEIIGRLLKTHNTKLFFVMVWVNGILTAWDAT